MLVFVAVFILGAGMMLGANGDRGLGLILGGRVLAGLGVGGCSMLTPIYISEISPPAVRGALVGIYELGWQIGGLVGFWVSDDRSPLVVTLADIQCLQINYGLNTTMAPSHKQWIIPFAVQLIPAGLLFLGALWIRESPRWLLSKNCREQAIKNLCWIRNLTADDIYIVEEIAFLDGAIEEQASMIGWGFWQPFKAVGSNRQVQWRYVYSIPSSPDIQLIDFPASSSEACSSSSKTAAASTPSTTTRPPSLPLSASVAPTPPS